MTHVVVVDGTNLWVQSRIAAQGVRIQGHTTEANPAPMLLFGQSLARRLRALQPVDHLVVAWDGLEATEHRRRFVPTYKKGGTLGGDDQPALALIWEWLTHIGADQVAVDLCEADDVIAWVARRGVFDRCTILSNDGDMLQLVTDKVSQIKLHPGPIEAATWDLERVEVIMGRPEWIPIFKAFVGDRSDGVVGVPNIGPARCRKLGDRYGWDMDAMMNDIMCQRYKPQIEANFSVVNLLGPLGVEAVERWRGGLDLPALIPFVPRDAALSCFYEKCNIDPIDLGMHVSS